MLRSQHRHAVVLSVQQGMEIIRGLRGLNIVGANLAFEMLCVLPGMIYRD